MKLSIVYLLLFLMQTIVVLSLLKNEEQKEDEERVNLNISNQANGHDTDIFSDESKRINIAFTFTKAGKNPSLVDKFKVCIESLLKYSTINLNVFILGDIESQLIAKSLFKNVKNVNNIEYDVLSVDTDLLAQRMHKLINKMQQHFSHSPSSYYGDSLFFLSIGLHKILDLRIKRIIMFDVDIKFKNDVRYLYEHFGEFSNENIIGIARDAQPVYRHAFWKYRSENSNTRVGSPPPNGLTGFNSGVLLLNLDKIRESSVYESLLSPENVEALTRKYYFKGNLGDQDFFTLISIEHEELFYILPCTWNRQLCEWWRDHGYAAVFNDYYRCEGKINIYHGNCNTQIPEDDNYDSVNVAEANVKIEL